MPDSVRDVEVQLSSASPEEIKESRALTEIDALRAVPYRELVALAQFLDEHTPFSTKHGVKGAEFDNVLAVFGRGWSHYNWKNFLEWAEEGVPPDKTDAFERNRNLFYVACSRPKKRLALLFTQELSSKALSTLAQWFGAETIHSIVP